MILPPPAIPGGTLPPGKFILRLVVQVQQIVHLEQQRTPQSTVAADVALSRHSSVIKIENYQIYMVHN